MARTKEFDQDVALHEAVRLFSQQGLAATSTEELMQAMKIGRQSMYDTYGGKKELFLKALHLYVTESCGALLMELRKSGPPLEIIQNALISFAERKDMSSADGCMGLNAIAEFGQRDPEVIKTIRAAADLQHRTLLALLQDAAAKNQLAHEDIQSAAGFFDATLAGIRFAAKAGKSRKALRAMAIFAAKALSTK
ncbi:TetR/AcrR family transcriptional regulator [Acidicapsa ligni]|uniref:TetR/AcrR family transcriptional regulator n=1 Tax=Acidicapsa ligni TaxID=542300 RepID=UPI0021E0E0B6|nr:TetR family transcriptional regulator [Acidicapsa ligni]